MAHSLSAKKRIRQDEKRKMQNKSVKRSVKTQIKKLATAIEGANVGEAQAELSRTMKSLDQAAAKNVIHKNAASRKKSRLARKVNKLAADSTN